MTGPYYGQFDPPLDQVLYERYFRDRGKPGVFVECGAFDGQTECTCKFFEESLGWSGVNVEPSPPIFERLVVNRPNSRNVNAALASRDGVATFHGIVHPEFGEQCTNGSLSHHPTHAAFIADAGWETRDYSVKTISWPALVAQAGLTQVDLLVLDVEGAELDVIAGMRGAALLPEVFCAEHGHLGVQALRDAIEPLGYRYDGSAEVNSFFVKQSPMRRWLQRMVSRLST
jgi:FkbM family methyltransferase